jgi:TusA-related sulfurtransferase
LRRDFLDARELEHPVPLELAIDALKKLDRGSYFYMLHRKEPIPLLALASEHKLNCISKNIGKEWHILISPNSEINLEEFLDI